MDRRLALLSRLRSAVSDPGQESEIVILYQPQVALATGRADSVEALIRWNPPDRDTLPTEEPPGRGRTRGHATPPRPPMRVPAG
jgi:sensor c-di-GMP phosphodiesterase-like protein